ncbi:3-phenylpropionate/cinnamic acid dioxygenase ferredoxin--NAD(+) reductase component [Aquamicrobium terrae]
MADNQETSDKPDLAKGIAEAELVDGGMLVGHVEGASVLLVRRGEDIFAIGAECTHYNGPLAEGLVVGDTIRCPWHHARFDLRTGEAVAAPALAPVGCWSVERLNGKIVVGKKKPTPKHELPAGSVPQRIVVIGGGAAGFAAAQRLRNLGYAGSLVMLSDDADLPVDRPNLSKDFLAGSAPQDWMPLRGTAYYEKQNIDLRLATKAAAIDVAAREVRLADGTVLAFDRLLLATGAEPVRLPLPGADLPHVLTLRSFADCRTIIAQAETARSAVVMGASFIGLEVAAALRQRGLTVHVVAPDKRPMERVLGPQIGDFVRALHEKHGVVFHLEETASTITATEVRLAGGSTLAADLVVLGVGVRPRTQLAEAAGLKIDRGVAVDAYLETSAPGIFAAGDIARWPDPHSGAAIRVEHWVVAERQGQAAAENMLGGRRKYTDAPFFWSRHYDMGLNYVGHAEAWDAIDVDGDIAAGDCTLRYKQEGRTLAVVTMGRDIESLAAEAAMEAGVATA